MASKRRIDSSGQYKKGEKEAELTSLQIDLLDNLGHFPESKGEHMKDERINNVLQRFQFVMCKQPKLMENAIEILDNYDTRTLPCFQSATIPSRFFYIVQGKDDDYICLPNYCPCRSFFERARRTTGEVRCKHLVAIRLFTALGLVDIKVLPDAQFVEKMSTVERRRDMMKNELAQQSMGSANPPQYLQSHTINDAVMMQTPIAPSFVRPAYM